MTRRLAALKALGDPAWVIATLVALAFTMAAALAIGDAHAQVAPVPSTTAAPASPVFGMMQGLVGLGIVIGLIYAAAWAMRKIGPRTRASGVVQVVGGASVGPREKVVVVRFGDQTLLLGVAPGQVSLLCQAGAHEVLSDPTAPAATTPPFGDRLRAARGDA